MSAGLLLLPGALVIWAAALLRLTGVIGWRRMFCAMFWASTEVTVVWSASHGSGPLTALGTFDAIGSLICWRHAHDDDDDDDRWKRLLAWGKSKIPRPTIRYHRPALNPAGAVTR